MACGKAAHKNAVDGGGAGDQGADSAGDLEGQPDGGSLSVDGQEPFFAIDIGRPCPALGVLACSETDLKQSLICNQGIWQALPLCPADQNCDRSSGVCTTLVLECAGRAAGYAYCEADSQKVCGPDLVSLRTTSCVGKCRNGACEVPSCGDGKIELGEECDDGNMLPADGCEADCTLSKITALAAGGTHTCALTAKGDVRCWGGNTQGQLGLGTAAVLSGQKPYQNGIVNLSAVATAIATGSRHTCALVQDGTVRCWGANDFGQLGLGHAHSIGDDEVPDALNATVNLGLKSKAISAGGNVTCAILEDDSARCWGHNNYGQLGLGHTRDIGVAEQPTANNAQVILDDGVLAIGTGGNHTCAVMKSNPILVRCWGHNNLGQLGLGRTDDIGDDEPPTAVPAIHFLDLGQFVAIYAGETRTFALLDTGGARGWGDNSDAGLGLGTAEVKPLNKATDWGNFSFSSPVQKMSMGGLHTCARLQDHKLRCWGVNDDAQLGTGDTLVIGDFEPIEYFSPVNLGADADGRASYAASVAAGARHTCVVLGSGRVSCWGYNQDGQLGLGYASTDPTQPFVGGTAATIPANLPRLEIFAQGN